DLVVWGHEHESRIEAVESDVKTFCIVQPGSSVATRLVEWESVAKKVTVLEIAGSEFRVRPVRLANFNGFKTGKVKLNDPDHGLDVEDPKIDDKVTNLLEMRVKELIQEARDGMVEQEDESATMKEELETEYYTTRNLNRKRIIPKKGTTKSSKESRSARSCSRSSL
ncbi:hypothetical protein ScalyP_jg2269, partial [Parmales sp. scaly parma]